MVCAQDVITLIVYVCVFNSNKRLWPSHYKIIEKSLKASSSDFESHNIIQLVFHYKL